MKFPVLVTLRSIPGSFGSSPSSMSKSKSLFMIYSVYFLPSLVGIAGMNSAEGTSQSINSSYSLTCGRSASACYFDYVEGNFLVLVFRVSIVFG